MIKKRVLPYLPIIFLSLIIFYTVEIAYTVRKFLSENFGKNVYNIVYVLILLVIAYAVFSIIKSKKSIVLRLILMAAIGTIYFFLLKSLKYPVEKIHYVEYGILAALGYNAFSKDFKNPVVLLLSLLLPYYIGLTDEFLQYLNPKRVGEFRDVFINVNAGFWGLLTFLTIKTFSFKDLCFPKKDFRFLFISIIIGLIGALGFVETVHGYGYHIKENDKVSFFSYFQKEKLLNLNKRLINRGKIDSKHVGIYNNEASRHTFQRDFYLTNKFYYEKDKYYIDYGKSFNENLILEKYYTYYLDREKVRWDSTTYALAKKGSKPFKDRVWNSRVKETVITSFPKNIARLLFIVAVLVCLILYATVYKFRFAT